MEDSRGGSVSTVRRREWRKFEEERGAYNTTSIHINNIEGTNGQDKHKFPRFLTDATVYPALKRAILRCSIYNFPVRYKMKREEEEELKSIRGTNILNDNEYHKLIETVRSVFNEEQERWGLSKLRSSYNQYVRGRLRDG